MNPSDPSPFPARHNRARGSGPDPHRRQGLRPKSHFVIAALTFGVLAGCQDLEGEVPLPDANFDRFVTDIQPSLASRCANSLCHGTPDRNLQVYAIRFHRLDPDDLDSDAPMSQEELRLNYLSAIGFIVDIEAPEDSLLLLKPLAVAEGGAKHAGDTQFAEPGGVQYSRMLDWITDALD